MKYLEEALGLKSSVETINQIVLSRIKEFVENPANMFMALNNKEYKTVEMEEFSNDFVNKTLTEYPNSNKFVITDIATMNVGEKQLTYFLYKVYNNVVDKGMVLYQVIDVNSLEPVGELQFSNIEDNIFYNIDAPEVEESSCNAMETNKKVENGKSIVFFIGHMDEERLLYDIQRLVFDTVNNVVNHSKLTFNFIISISKFGGIVSENLKSGVEAIEKLTKNNVKELYPNSNFEFKFE